MAEERIKGLAGVDFAPVVTTTTGIPAVGAWVAAGVTYRDEASLTEDDGTDTEHYSNENDDPEESDTVPGKKKLVLAFIDWTPANCVKWFGGTISGAGATEVWEAPVSRSKQELAVRLRSKNGKYITLVRVSFSSKIDYKLAPSGIAKMVISGTVLASAVAGGTPMIKGKL